MCRSIGACFHKKIEVRLRGRLRGGGRVVVLSLVADARRGCAASRSTMMHTRSIHSEEKIAFAYISIVLISVRATAPSSRRERLADSMDPPVCWRLHACPLPFFHLTLPVIERAARCVCARARKSGVSDGGPPCACVAVRSVRHLYGLPAAHVLPADEAQAAAFQPADARPELVVGRAESAESSRPRGGRRDGDARRRAARDASARPAARTSRPGAESRRRARRAVAALLEKPAISQYRDQSGHQPAARGGLACGEPAGGGGAAAAGIIARIAGRATRGVRRAEMCTNAACSTHRHYVAY